MNRRLEKRVPVWLGWTGDMGHVTEFLLTKTWTSPWCVPKTINSILRAVGVVAFANSPLAGFLIMAGMFVGNVAVFFGCLLAGVIGVVFSKILNQPERLISDGVTVFNGILVGCISVAVFPVISGHGLTVYFWLYLTIAVIMCAYVDKGLNALMSASKLPALSIPFNITAAIMLLSMRSAAGLTGAQVPQVMDEVMAEVNATTMATTTNVTEEIDWHKVFEGTLLAAGQVYGVGTIDSSILIFLGFFLFSPLLTLYFYLGSVIGTVTGALVSVAPYSDVYAGLWGYNAMLTTGGMSYFLVPTPSLFFAAIVGAGLATGVQAASLHIFSAYTVPVLSYPFNVATLLFLAISTTPDPPLVWVPCKTFPELHLVQHLQALRRRKALGDVEEPLQTTTKE